MNKNPLILIFSLIVSSCNQYVDCSQVMYKDSVSFYENEKFTGDCISKYFDGSIKSKQSYLNGKDHGSWTFYYSNGNQRTEAYFEDGKRIKQWKYYASNGEIWKINSYDSLGKPTGKWETYDTLNGKLISKKLIK